jgi:hypothetical protein
MQLTRNLWEARKHANKIKVRKFPAPEAV